MDWRGSSIRLLSIVTFATAAMCSSEAHDFESARQEGGAAGQTVAEIGGATSFAGEGEGLAGKLQSSGGNSGEGGASPDGRGAASAGGVPGQAGAGGAEAGGAAGAANENVAGAAGAAGFVYDCGDLESAQSATGAAQRLVNLGYLSALDTDSAYKAALKQFQTDQGLTPDGVLGPMTANRLIQINGC